MQARLERRSALSTFFRNVTEASGLQGTQKDIETGLFIDGPLEEIFFMVFRNQDNRTWQMWPVIISDLGKDSEELKREIGIFLAKPDRSYAQTMQMNMKQVVYYLFTGTGIDKV
jgi:hypothetical protein